MKREDLKELKHKVGCGTFFINALDDINAKIESLKDVDRLDLKHTTSPLKNLVVSENPELLKDILELIRLDLTNTRTNIEKGLAKL